MKLLTSKRLKLPTLYFITDRNRIKELPIGVPFIYGDVNDEKHLIRMLEYEVLYQKALASGYPFNFRKILKDAGYKGLERYDYHHPVFMDYVTTTGGYDIDNLEENAENIYEGNTFLFKRYIKDTAAYIDIQKLKDLNVFPIWVDKIEEAISTNLHNFAVFNTNMYNKKLEGMYGGLELTSPKRNLIIVDISCSIPKGVSSTLLVMSKNMAETFFADILVTGRISVVYPYELLHELNVEKVYEEVGMANESECFRKLLFGEEKEYKTAIVFGDNDHPGNNWNREGYLSDEDGKKRCKWKVDKLITFHTSSRYELPGYSRWFDTENIEKIDNWVKYLN